MSVSDPLAVAKSLLKPALPPDRFRVYVFGPGLDVNAVEPTPSSEPLTTDQQILHARYLRHATKNALEKEGFSVDYGETSEILTFWEDLFKADNPAVAETLHADRMCGAIIIFPASIGAIAELALFSRDMTLAEKTMALVHQGRSEEMSFFRLGLLELFQTYNGRVQFIDYSRHDACVKYAVRYVRGIYNRFLGEIRTVTNIRRRHRGTVNEEILNEDAL